MPLGSWKGTPLAWAMLPGAWLAITSRAVGEACRIGRGPAGRSVQKAQARASASRASNVFGSGVGEEGILDLGVVDRLLLAEAGAEQGEMLDLDVVGAEQVVALYPAGDL